MGECRGGAGDGLIKLFGKTIPVPEAGAAAAKDLQNGGSVSTESDGQESTPQDTADPSPQPEVVDAEAPPPQSGGSGDDAASQKEKLKKPDKILPCPRCNSMDTKFCYFNNYNVNQPRHFCKNCQRYWTAGGAMRNVPVGAGRRKNKNAHAASHFLQRVRAALPTDPLCAPPVKTNGATVLSFSHDAPALDLAGQMTHLKEKLNPVAVGGRAGNAGDNPSMGPCSESSSNGDDKDRSSSDEKLTTVEKSVNGAQHPGMSAGVMWPYSCAPSPAYYTSGIAIPIYPAPPPYWGCMVPGAWGLPWPVQSQSGPNSLALGKHPREGDEERGHGSGKVWMPKTTRIDNADEVAKSSIWSLVGINGHKETGATGEHKLAAVFEPKRDAKTAKHAVMTSLSLLHANPVALTRSATFQEGS